MNLPGFFAGTTTPGWLFLVPCKVVDQRVCSLSLPGPQRLSLWEGKSYRTYWISNLMCPAGGRVMGSTNHGTATVRVASPPRAHFAVLVELDRVHRLASLSPSTAGPGAELA